MSGNFAKKKSRISSARKREKERKTKKWIAKTVFIRGGARKIESRPVAAADDRREGLNTENLARG